ncbi:stage ii sporulation protein required for processing of pro-sigma-e (spoiir) [hydrocarbon metagenome]|uniref:Stage ii sporulation protein required for processing of pro-sigma-e (Spoiir) n=1 Tax=hydrocarbon metagenome TaxID=938273 RepID=A0A0W8E994_9ZZZZ
MKKTVVIMSVIIIIILGSSYYYAQDNSLNESVLRLHVIANSDSVNDQALKIAVKNEVVALLNTEFAEQQDVEQARQLAVRNIPRIQELAEKVIEDQGYDYSVQVKVGEYMFPTKSYGNLVFPQGEYKALRIIIGDGVGKNWWCVLFPPLCMVSDSDKGLSFEKQEEAQVSLKCLELLPKGVRLKLSSH